jgi:hypothetical protein
MYTPFRHRGSKIGYRTGMKDIRNKIKKVRHKNK